MSRIERLTRRIERLERALSAYDRGGPHFEARGRLVTWVIARLREDGIDSDPDKSDSLSEEDLEHALEALADLIDDRTDWPEPLDTLLDLGVDAVLEVVAAIVFGKKHRLERRLDRLKRRLARLQS